jgi:uncharacterized protein GlcG (DUF336 family)
MKRLLLVAGLALALCPIVRAGAAEVPLDLAVDAAQAAIAACKANGYAITVTILDADLATRLVLRSNGARDGSVQIGYRKAYTVIKTGMTSGDFGKTVLASPASPASPTSPAAAANNDAPKGPPGPVNGDPNLITWAGGLPIMAGGAVVGAISASGAPGGDKDEACVKAGLAKIADRLK